MLDVGVSYPDPVIGPVHTPSPHPPATLLTAVLSFREMLMEPLCQGGT